MRTVIVTDETAERMTDVLRRSADGRAVLELFTAPEPGLPTDGELFLAVREKRTPAIVTVAAERLEAAEVAVERTRSLLHAIVRDAHELGVPIAVISRWTGYNRTTIYRILGREAS